MTRAHPNERQGRAAEQRVAEEFGLEHRPDETEWYDAVDPSTGTKYEVKSTHKSLEDGSVGRFRLWRDQHRSLLASNARGTAWYVFVLFDSNDNIVAIQRRQPSTVGRAVDSWNDAHHHDRGGPQHKLAWSEVVDL